MSPNSQLEFSDTAEIRHNPPELEANKADPIFSAIAKTFSSCSLRPTIWIATWAPAYKSTSSNSPNQSIRIYSRGHTPTVFHDLTIVLIYWFEIWINNVDIFINIGDRDDTVKFGMLDRHDELSINLRCVWKVQRKGNRISKHRRKSEAFRLANLIRLVRDLKSTYHEV